MSASSRRVFLQHATTFVAAAGFGAGATFVWPRTVPTVLAGADPAAKPDFEKRLRDLKLELPTPGKAVAVYVPAVIAGNLLYTAGHLPWIEEGRLQTGKLGEDLTIEQGAAAARLVALQTLATIRQELGALNRIRRLVKTLGFVNCTSGFTQQPKVINGFSELMVELFGPVAGKGARSAIGVTALPLNAAVEIEAVFQIGDD